jgi:hypothetical protein
MKSLKLVGLSACLAVLSALQTRAQQPQIGIQFLGRINNPPSAGLPAPTATQLQQNDIAGVVPQQAYNIIDNVNDPLLGGAGAGGTVSSLLDSNLVTTTVSLTYVANDSWYNDTDPTTITTPNAELLNGIVKSNGSDGKSESFRFSGVPEGQYDLYVYTTMNGDGVEADVTDQDHITTYYINEWHQFRDTNTFVQATNTNPNGPRDTGNYVRLANLGTYGRGTIGAIVTRRGTAGDGTGVPALQLVPAGASQPNVTPLSFLSEPTSRRGAAGDTNITFSASIRGPASYSQWLKNGAPIPGETNLTYTPSPIVSGDNLATIAFTASNNLNSITSSNAVLTVGQYVTNNGVGVLDGGIINLTQQPASVTVIANRGINGPQFTVAATTAGFTGDTSGAQPPLTYQWYSAPKGSSTFTVITNATRASYRAPLPSQLDDGTQFKVNVTYPNQFSSVAVMTVLPNTNPPVVLVGAFARNDGTNDSEVEVGVSFDEQVNPATLIPANFSLNSGTITSLKVATNSFVNYQAAILKTTGLTQGSSYTLTAQNVTDLSGNVLKPTNVNFTVSSQFKWSETGVPPAPGQVIPVGANGFDILNGGRQEWNSYEEIDMAYVKKTNDFDVRLQVIFAEPGSEWTRVGLQARNALDAGIPSDANGQSANSTNHLFSAYAQTHVNPNQTLGSNGQWDPNDPVQPGNVTPNNGHEQNERLTAGAATQGWGSPSGNGIDMSYPDVWLRLTRVGTVLHGYRSVDGVNWTDQGTTTLTDQKPDMYVGPFLGVETGNIWTSGYNVWTDPFNPQYDRLFVAEFRNFGDTPTVTPVPTISIGVTGSTITITYTGTLLSSTNVGPTAVWSAVAGATSPYPVPTTSGEMFFRTK